MATLTVKRLPRVFKYQGTEMPDPSPTATPEQALKLLATSYPQLTNASVESPVVEGGKLVCNIKVAVGTKG
jgi:PRTRC genetic system protein C